MYSSAWASWWWCSLDLTGSDGHETAGRGDALLRWWRVGFLSWWRSNDQTMTRGGSGCATWRGLLRGDVRFFQHLLGAVKRRRHAVLYSLL
jgi:hypothetical protein